MRTGNLPGERSGCRRGGIGYEAGNLPITIGGDHSLAIGSIAGAASHYKKHDQTFGLIWFDAHGDINTPDTSASGNVHGMPLAVSLGRGDEKLVNLKGFSPKIPAKRSVLIGIRDVDPPERDMINQTGNYSFYDEGNRSLGTWSRY